MAFIKEITALPLNEILLRENFENSVGPENFHINDAFSNGETVRCVRLSVLGGCPFSREGIISRLMRNF